MINGTVTEILTGNFNVWKTFLGSPPLLTGTNNLGKEILTQILTQF